MGLSHNSCAAVDARTLQRVEALEQSFLQHQQQVQTQLDSMQVSPSDQLSSSKQSLLPALRMTSTLRSH